MRPQKGKKDHSDGTATLSQFDRVSQNTTEIPLVWSLSRRDSTLCLLCALPVFLSQIYTHTHAELHSISGRCSHPHGLSQHRQCFVSHKGSPQPDSGALFGPRQPHRPRLAPCATPSQPAEVPRGTSVQLVKSLHWSSHTECCLYSSVCVHVSQWEYNTPRYWESPCPHNKWCERNKCAARLRSQWSKCPCSPPANHTLWNRVMLTRTNRWGERWENWEELRLNEWKHTEMVIFYHRMLPRVHGWACDRPHCSVKATQCL